VRNYRCCQKLGLSGYCVPKIVNIQVYSRHKRLNSGQFFETRCIQFGEYARRLMWGMTRKEKEEKEKEKKKKKKKKGFYDEEPLGLLVRAFYRPHPLPTVSKLEALVLQILKSASRDQQPVRGERTSPAV